MARHERSSAASAAHPNRYRARRRAVTAVAGACLTVVAISGCGPPSSAPGGGEVGVVVKVIDGDTVDVDISGTTTRIRLIGIDTPETHRPGTPVECYGPEASSQLRRTLPAGTGVRVETDQETTDRYRRTLAYLYRLDDGVMVNQALVHEGFAAPYPHPPNTRHADELAWSAGLARQASRGLWGACGGPHVPQAPPAP